MNNSYSYNIHNILKIKIHSKNINLFYDFFSPFTYFKTDNEDQCNIILNINKFKPNLNDCVIIDHKYFVKDNYFYCKDYRGRINWEVEIKNFEKDRTEVNFNSNIIGIEELFLNNYIAQNMIVKPLVELKMVDYNIIPIHGLSFSYKNEGYIFIARGGSHKTNMALSMFNDQNFRLLGDDKVFMGKNKCIYSYPIFESLLYFKYHNKKEDVTTIFDMFNLFKYMLYKKEYQNIFISEASFDHLVTIKKSALYSDVHIQTIKKKELIEKIINSNKLEMFESGLSKSFSYIPFFKYMNIYSYVFPNSRIESYWKRMYNLLNLILDKQKYLDITLPSKYSNILLNKIIKSI